MDKKPFSSAWLPGFYPVHVATGPPAVTSNPALPGDAALIGRPRPTLPPLPGVGGPAASSWQTPARGRVELGGVDRKVVEGQRPSSLITPMQLQRQKPGAFDTAFIGAFVPLSTSQLFVDLRQGCLSSLPAPPRGDQSSSTFILVFSNLQIQRH